MFLTSGMRTATAIDAHIMTEQGRDDHDGPAGTLVPVG
jgi:hypothetical protein